MTLSLTCSHRTCSGYHRFTAASRLSIERQITTAGWLVPSRTTYRYRVAWSLCPSHRTQYLDTLRRVCPFIQQDEDKAESIVSHLIAAGHKPDVIVDTVQRHGLCAGRQILDHHHQLNTA